jgi:hypothetical protein
MFFKEMRASMADNEELPGLTSMVTRVSTAWKELPQEGRVKYELLAQEDSGRYRREMNAYHDEPAVRLQQQQQQQLEKGSEQSQYLPKV